MGLALAATAALAVPSPAASGTVVAGELGRRLDAAAQAAAKDGLHGVVLVAKDGEEVLAKGYGRANEATGAAYTPDTVVPIGSCLKDFTKVAIYQLVEAGRLGLDTTVGALFPDAPPDKRPITVRQLLEHRAGLPLGVGQGDDAPLSKAEFLAKLFAHPLESAPGTTERYSNAGFSLLAAVVEARAGEPYEAYLASHVARPLGLGQTGLYAVRWDPARLAHAYLGGEDQGTMLDKPREADGLNWSLRGNGGWVSTVRDMLRFYRGVRGETLLREPAHRDAILPPGGPTVLAGSDLVSFFLYASYPGARTEVVIATNRDEFKAPRLLRALEPLLGVGEPDESALGPELAALPDDGQGRTVAAYLEAFNGGEDGGMRDFFAHHAAPRPDAPPLEQRLESFHRLRGEFGKLTVRAVRRAGTMVVVHADAERGAAVKLVFDVGDQPPFALRGIGVDVGGEGPRRRPVGGDAFAALPAVALPDTPRGRVVAAYLAALNAGDEAAATAFFQSRAADEPQAPPLAKRLETMHRLHRDLGPVVVVRVEETADGLRVTVRGRQGVRASLTFRLDAAEPVRFHGLGVEVG